MINVGVSVKCFTCVDLMLIINLAFRHSSSYDVPLQNKRSLGGTIHPPPTTICLFLCRDEETFFKREISGVTFFLILVYQINLSVAVSLTYIHVSYTGILIGSCKSTNRFSYLDCSGSHASAKSVNHIFG